MKISPLEIRQKTFEKNFRGYDKEEVDAFLLSLSQEWERVMDESKELKLKVVNSEKEVQKLREVETTLYKTLKTAEDTGVNLVGQAQKTAELITKESQMNAEAILSDARTKAKYLYEDAEEKVKNVQFQAQNKVHEIVLELKNLEHQKQNLVHEVRQFAQSLIDRINLSVNSSVIPDYDKMIQKEEPIRTVLKEEILTVEKEIEKESTVTTVNSERDTVLIEAVHPSIEEEPQKEQIPAPKVEPKPEVKKVLSFFDQI